MKIEWHDNDIYPKRRVGKPKREEVWMIGYIASETSDKRFVLVSMSDGCVLEPMTKAEMAKSLNDGGEMPLEFIKQPIRSQTRYFTLTGMVVHELKWHSTLRDLVTFRQNMRRAFGLQMREEIHAGAMLTKPGDLFRIKKNDRLTIIRLFLDELATMRNLNFINVRVDKQGKPADYNPFEKAWEALIQRFENTLNYRNFPGPWLSEDVGVIFSDAANETALRGIYRRMRVHNPVPNMRTAFTSGYRQLPLNRIAEDPTIRHSHHSYFIQSADAAAFALYQYYAPSSYVRRKGARKYLLNNLSLFCA